MPKNNLHLAIEVSHAAEVGVKRLKTEAGKKGVNYLEVPIQGEQHLFLYPISQKLSDVLDETGLDLGTDEARFGLSWINNEDETIIKSDLSKKIDSIEFKNDTCHLFDIPQVIDFINSNPEIIEIEKSTLVDNTSEQDNEDLEVPDEFTDSKDQQEQLESIESDEEENYSKSELSSMFDGENEEPQQVATPNNDIEDRLLDAAINIFNKNTIGDELPSLDQKTQELVNSDLVEANEHIDTARKEAVLSIYKSLNDNNTKEKAKAESEELAQAQEDYEKNIAQIKSNCKAKLDKLAKDEAKVYEDKKKQAGKIKLEEFYQNYDAEHLHEVNDLISHKSIPIKQEMESEIETENQNYEDYKQKVSEAIFNHVTENADIEAAVTGFRKILNNEKERILTVVKNAETENSKLKQELAETHSKLEIIKQTSDSRVKAKVAEEQNKLSQPYRIQVEEADKKRKKAESEADNWKQRYFDSQQQAENLRRDFKELSDKVNNKITVQEEIDKYKTELNKQNSVQQPTPVVVHDTHNEKSIDKSSDSTWKKYIGIAGIVAAAMALTGIFTATIVGSHQSQQTTTAIQSSTANTTASATKQSDSTPDTFTYTAKNGKKYAVIKDDEHSGHYVDDKGVSHTVVFNAK